MVQNRDRPYVLAWRLKNRKVVVVGGGSIGTAKIETLLETGARLLVIDPTPSRRVRELCEAKRLSLRTRRARFHDVVGAALVVAATGDTATNRRIRRWSKACGAVVNAVDDKENCDVTVPAVIHRGPATIAITTAGASPAAARFLREELTDVVRDALPARTDVMLRHASGARADLKNAGTYRYDYAAWRQRFFEPALDAVRRQQPHVIGDIRERFHQEFAHGPAPVRPGSVTLVGAGPGAADLITVRGAQALADADVILYDRLADPDLLALAPAAAERIPVGKGKGFGPRQHEINDLLVEKARAGNNVVRLKGGDPFVFGRGAEEVDDLVAAGLEVEVVPGVSSAIAAPELAGIPLTDRRVASSFTVLTGHLTEDSMHHWQCFADSGSTLVVLMATTTAASVAKRLLDAGRAKNEPVAFIHAAGSAQQDVTRTTLHQVCLTGCPFPSPSVMVVGAVASSQNHEALEASMAPGLLV